MKFKKIMSTVLATAMVFGMSVIPASATETSFVPTEDGTYTSTKVTAYQYYSPTSLSMCNGAFSAEVDLTIDGEWADLTLYVCNPTPGTWGGLEDGILIDPAITYDDVVYTGELTSIGYENQNAAMKLYNQDSAFFGITAGDVLASDVMEFTIPTAALASELHVTAHVNLVMDSTQNFWLDIEFVEPTTNTTPDTTPDTVPDVTTQNVDVYATVLSNESTFTVTVPEKIEFKELGTSVDTAVEYAVEVSDFVKGNDNASVQVVSESGVLTVGSNTIDFANSFGTQTANENATFTGTLTVKAADAAAVPAGDYTGTVTFAISTVK